MNDKLGSCMGTQVRTNLTSKVIWPPAELFKQQRDVVGEYIARNRSRGNSYQ